jgi:hypothetical protein
MVEAVWGLIGLVRQQLRYLRTGPPQRELLFSGHSGIRRANCSGERGLDWARGKYSTCNVRSKWNMAHQPRSGY